MCGAAILLMASCGGNARKQANQSDSLQGVDTVLADSVDSLYTSSMHVGDVQVLWVRDNAEPRRMPCQLFPAASQALLDSLGLQEGIPSTVSAFWVIVPDGTRILFDTGLGSVVHSRLLSGLKERGVEPYEVKYIYLTHMHGDHIGGMLKPDGTPAFPSAEVYVSAPEYDYWLADKTAHRQQVQTMEAYKDRLHLFHFGDTLPGGVVALDAVGHTPGHTVFQAGRLLVIGDLMHGMALQEVHPEICASFDMDTVQAVRARRHFLRYAQDNGLTMAGMHLPAPAFR